MIKGYETHSRPWSNPGLHATVLAFCGWSGSGKTTLLESLIPRLVGRGLSVGVVKHDAHGVQLDTPGKDSDRLFSAGADVALRGPNEVAMRRHPSPSTPLGRTLRCLTAEHDVVLVEGHKRTPLPKVWLATADDDRAPADALEVIDVFPWSDDRVARAEATVLGRLSLAWASRPVLAGVLVGGASRRMGQPKQLLDLGGSTMVERVVDALRGQVDEVVLLGSGAVPARIAGLRRLPDAPGHEGPLGGLLGALRWAPAACWVAAACDLPLVSPAAIGWLLSRRRPGTWAVLPRTHGGVEPLLAVYEPHSLGLLEDLAAAEKRAPRHLESLPGVESPEPPAELRCCWFDANTPDDVLALRAG